MGSQLVALRSKLGERLTLWTGRFLYIVNIKGINSHTHTHKKMTLFINKKIYIVVLFCSSEDVQIAGNGSINYA